MSVSPYVLITGSRAWGNDFLIYNVLATFNWMWSADTDEPPALVTGKCPRGADAICERVAGELGWREIGFPAMWDSYGRNAGFIRNAQMVDFVKNAQLAGDPAICLAFILDDSKGATGCADLAEKAGIETLRYRRYSDGLSTGKPHETGPVEQGDPDLLRSIEAIERRQGTPTGEGYLW